MTKVIRNSDGKIFSSPKGVALNVGKPIAKAVGYCCKGYIPTVEGESYEWFYDDDTDRGRPEYVDSYWDRRGKWITRGWVLKWRAQFIRLWLADIRDPLRWRKAGEVAEGICRAAESSGEVYKWEPTTQSISRHLHTYQAFYGLVFGMKTTFMDTPIYKGRMFKFVLEEADKEYETVLEELANDCNWGRGKPVIRTNDNTWFRSMSEAERLTKIPYYQIYHCCEGDIDDCEVPLTGERLIFKYATEADS
ncbi:hypothetical protein AC477_00130 [miscellaneous Crenarchaeota group-1 archaeon SG8-32-1]|uniref:Uncharacterized protein n=1 Tax=miscellaneous Crenarchaeota group-1 archaeon SG8-32-1 TaxID=1685124 RepID=A0A0M0C1I8_9ARCH|nr:MAG: hypothetical protein AC477_00130 [miscellaneous Crenarchaeota group-1 archaeon SG8-32-1]